MPKTAEKNHAIENALAHLESIRELLARFETAYAKGDDSFEPISEEIAEYPLSVLVRSPWHSVYERDESISEYEILLTTGGPALRIRGEVEYGQPTTARLEWQDWGTPWTELHPSEYPEGLKPSEADEILKAFASHFYYEEG